MPTCTNCEYTNEREVAFRAAAPSRQPVCLACFHEHFTIDPDTGQTLARPGLELDLGLAPESLTVEGRRCNACGDQYSTTTHDRSEYFCRCCAAARTWENTGFHVEEPTYRRTLSKRKFGVEIETHEDFNYRDLRPHTCFACVPDGSTNGMEFVSPVLYGDQGLDAVKDVCEFARDNNWSVDSACGLHLHCDVSGESDENLKKIAIAYHYTYELWTSFISDSRKRNYYCAKHRWSPSTLLNYEYVMDWVNDVIGGTRYTWCNWNAYGKHKTVELRFHSATLSANKITKFVKANLRFIDWVCSLSMDEVNDLLGGTTVKQQFDAISEYWGPSVSEFYLERAESFGKPIVSTPMVGAS